MAATRRVLGGGWQGVRCAPLVLLAVQVGARLGCMGCMGWDAGGQSGVPAGAGREHSVSQCDCERRVLEHGVSPCTVKKLRRKMGRCLVGIGPGVAKLWAAWHRWQMGQMAREGGWGCSGWGGGAGPAGGGPFPSPAKHV